MERKQKQPLLILFAAAFVWCSPCHAGWWNNDEQNQQLQSELNQAHQENNGEGIVILILAVGVVISLGVGAAVGSKARRAFKQREQ